MHLYIRAGVFTYLLFQRGRYQRAQSTLNINLFIIVFRIVITYLYLLQLILWPVNRNVEKKS